MTRRLAPLLLLLYATLAGAADGFLVPRRHALTSCGPDLSTTVSPYRRGLLRRFSMFQVVDGEQFGHHEFRISPEGGDHVESVELLDLVNHPGRWRRERWAAEGRDHWFYDVGFRTLETDAQSMNSLVAGTLLSSNAPVIRFTSSEARVRALEQLSTFRWACFDRVMQIYRNHRTKQKYLGEIDFEHFLSADRDNLNVDVFALTKEPLPWTAERRRLREQIVSSIQISYDRPYGDYLRPSLDGLLAAHNEPATVLTQLPFARRLDPARRDDFLAKFEATYQGSKCEITRYINRDTPRAIVARLILEIFERARERNCDLMVASGDAHSLRLFRRYGFQRYRGLPTLGSADEELAVLSTRDNRYRDVLNGFYERTRDVHVDDF